ncbi:MAG: DUF350 domain-containing protein [Gordonia sp. (in: high G+C Gram-positive bacteria)]|uniref:DUF350 domain-containing protein n=1 Tax=Gordonia sp. (in: high G+C Gram-positive bacteria) TaxID=84139 RepID=UPI003BB659D3
MTLLRDNLAELTSYGLVSLAVLIIGFAGLDLVTPGSLRSLVWRDNSRTAAVLAVAQVIGLTVALTAAINASIGLELWRGVLYTVLYGLVSVALMMFSFVLIDLLTPGRLGAVLLGRDTETTESKGQLHPAVWVNAATFVALGFFVSAALG